MRLFSLAFLGAIALGSTNAAAQTRMASLDAGAPSSSPIGWVQFCRENPADCRARSSTARVAQLTGAAFAQLVRTNLRVNAEIEQVSDQELFGVEEYWTYPVNGRGDCEDIVMEKKRRLIAAGWPREALLITVVRDLRGDGHAVLTVKTDRGDYILDNHTGEVKLWHETGYRFIKRQSQTDPNLWVSLTPGVSNPALASVPRR